MAQGLGDGGSESWPSGVVLALGVLREYVNRPDTPCEPLGTVLYNLWLVLERRAQSAQAAARLQELIPAKGDQ